jgi:hypothetical protein
VCLGLGLCFLSIIDIKNENYELLQQKLQALENEGEEGGSAPTEEAEADGENLVGDDKEKIKQQLIKDNENIFYILKNCSTAQKINFSMIFMVFTSHTTKLIYDSVAETFLKEIKENN